MGPRPLPFRLAGTSGSLNLNSHFLNKTQASLVAQSVMWQTWVQSPGQEDPLEKGMATHSNILAWRIPWTEEPERPQSTGSQKSDTT